MEFILEAMDCPCMNRNLRKIFFELSNTGIAGGDLGGKVKEILKWGGGGGQSLYVMGIL